MCNACGRKFAFPNQVLRHQKNYHMGEKKFACNDCNMRFATKTLLSLHIVKHSPARLFTCQYCDKTFKRAKNLGTHVRIHLNDKRYVCSLCKDAFVQQSSLKYHITRKHPETV
ncbi:unnamed protein product [Parnassius mnemosyne]|uniref:C2H2-type domain-containing protein n=1 Tax=Parnassius mnemosyne TaxID=213953 RepID=A0AAV1KZQ5_9NEOP